MLKVKFPKYVFRDGEFFDVKTTPNLLIECVAVLIGEYEPIRKKAANLLMKVILNDKAYKEVCELLESEVDVTDRNDPRVRKWTKEVLSRGVCEHCGATEKLEAHHLAHWSESPKDRIDVKNGVCLCHDCHCDEHRFDHVYRLMKARNY